MQQSGTCDKLTLSKTNGYRLSMQWYFFFNLNAVS